MDDDAARKAVVLKGVGGWTLRELLSTEVTSPRSASTPRTRSASFLSQNFSFLWTAMNCSWSNSNSPLINQYGLETNACLSCSFSTIKRSVGLCTRPTERNCLPKRDEASEMNLVSVAPQIKSMSCRASPALARSTMTSCRWANAFLTS